MTDICEALAEPPEVARIMELAERLCRSYEAMSIPTGELWRSITQDQFVRARKDMREAVVDLLRAALAAQPAQEPAAWIDNSGHPKHLTHVQSAAECRLYGLLRPLRWKCNSCDWTGNDAELLRAPSPFDATDIISGCPKCKAAEDFTNLCDEPGCQREAGAVFRRRTATIGAHAANTQNGTSHD